MTDRETDLYRLEAYDYELPESSIAQNPAEPRDSSRLLAWGVRQGVVEHRVFRDFVDYLNPGDLLVLNDTRVLPARLRGQKTSGGAKVEILLLSPAVPDYSCWKALVRPGRRLPEGAAVCVGDRVLHVEGRAEEGVRIVRVGSDRQDVLAFLDAYGEMPLPPYIKATTSPKEAYQTVFAQKSGSAAAPTASLHFTKDMLERIKAKKVDIGWITLHVGLGTFRPVKSEDIREHHIHNEFCEIPASTAEAVKKCRERDGKVVAAGTTVARTLESGALNDRCVRDGVMDTDLFIYPGYEYKVVDALLTNFHLPKSSLLMLVAALAAHFLKESGEDRDALPEVRKIYEMAVTEGYRFFSFGDAMFVRG